MSSASPIPRSVLHRYRLIPLSDDGQTLEIGSVEPMDTDVIDQIAFLTGRTIRECRVQSETIDTFLEDLDANDEPYEPVGSSSDDASGSPGATRNGTEGEGIRREETHGTDSARRMPSIEQGDGQLEADQIPDVSASPDRSHRSAGREASRQQAPLTQGSVVRQVDRIIERAIAQEASDIHIEPYETFFRVRFRKDGVLQTIGELDLARKDAVISRLKIMADLDIAEKRRPQDSRIRVHHDSRDIDLRVSTLPTAHGEKVVLRILDKNALSLDLDALGLDERDQSQLHRAIQSPTGQVLVTGPTGSGKTTTLYAALSTLNTDSVNITTIEDPIEFNLPGINQTRVRSDIGFGFAKALRSFLRQDPNVIMVGEIRDRDTAQIAVRAALTGHLVMSTLHTNDAPSTVTRLIDMGVEPYLVAASVRLIVAQRLVRRLCPSCAEETDADPTLLSRLGLEKDRPVMAAGGCETCSGTGFRGRTALFEMMPVTESIGELVAGEASTQQVRSQALDDGLRTLQSAAADAVRRGITTPREALREVAA